MSTVSRSGSNANSFTLLDNRHARLSDYLGKVVVVDFWATYCPPCLMETPQLVDLHKRYEKDGLRIIGLNVGGPDDRPKVSDFIDRFKIPYTMGYPDSEMSNLYMSDNDVIPQTFVFDRKGRLIQRFIGYDESVPNQLEQLVKSALNEASN
jgi:cytochrome c biogenesis protein CcmG/thiol:disulfide interchange protein DsbE